MAEIPVYSGIEEPRGNPRERRSTACSVCVWIFVLIICWAFWAVGTDPINNTTPEFALGFMVLMPFILIGFVVSIYKIFKNVSKWYTLGG
jgi:apolipoprotein N-acyltransferase